MAMSPEQKSAIGKAIATGLLNFVIVVGGGITALSLHEGYKERKLKNTTNKA